jgi:hypothetical protein
VGWFLGDVLDREGLGTGAVGVMAGIYIPGDGIERCGAAVNGKSLVIFLQLYSPFRSTQKGMVS